MNLSRLFLFCAAVLLAGCQSMQVPPAEKAGIRRTLLSFKQALNIRSFTMMQPLLTPDISLGGSGPELSLAALERGAAWVPFHVDDIQIFSLRPTPAGPEAKVALYSDAMVSMSRIGFDPAGRIRSIAPEPIWKTPEASVPNVLTSSFVVSDGLMFVKATVNGREGYMLFDTGASGLLLNPKYFYADGRDPIGVSSGVNGIRQSSAPVKVLSLKWQGLRAGGIDAQLHDFSSMEKPAITPLLGAISHAQLKNCAVAFDWKHKTIQVFATRSDGTKKAASNEPPPAVRLPFTYDSHLPVVPVRIGGRQYAMLFDSGAQVNLLPDDAGLAGHSRLVARLSGFSDGGRAVSSSAPVVVVDETLIGGVPFRDLPYAIHQVPYMPGRGFLGAPLLQTGRVEINFRAKQISIWK